MAALVQILGAIAVNEAFRSIEGASAHRFALRKAFGENVLLQAVRRARAVSAAARPV